MASERRKGIKCHEEVAMRALAFLVGALALPALARAPTRGVSRRYAGALEPIASPPVSVPAVAAGAFALGALAVGALAIGALAIGRLEVRKARLKEVEIGDLTVRRFRVDDGTRPQGTF
jgi:hypothetical protein